MLHYVMDNVIHQCRVINIFKIKKYSHSSRRQIRGKESLLLNHCYKFKKQEEIEEIVDRVPIIGWKKH